MSLVSAARRKLSEYRLSSEFAARGPWCTQFVIAGRRYGGTLDYREDKRVDYAVREFPQARTVLELGSLEGGQSVELARRLHAKIIAIEGRADSVRRAQWVQQMLGIRNISVVQGNLETIDLHQYGPVDLVFCSGILYHLPRPWELLAQIGLVSRNLFLSTHYSEDDRADENVEGYDGRYYSEFTDPLSGMSANSFLLTLDSLQQALRNSGFGAVRILETFVPPKEPIRIGAVSRTIGGSPQVHLVARQ
jgi:hypothetical protein